MLRILLLLIARPVLSTGPSEVAACGAAGAGDCWTQEVDVADVQTHLLQKRTHLHRQENIQLVDCTPAPAPAGCSVLQLKRGPPNEYYCPIVLNATGVPFTDLWNPDYDLTGFDQWITCSAYVNTAYDTCQAYCSNNGMTCLQGIDNDNHNESGQGTGCTRYPIPDSKITPHIQTTAQNGCLQLWKNQICQCGIPPECNVITPAPTPLCSQLKLQRPEKEEICDTVTGPPGTPFPMWNFGYDLTPFAGWLTCSAYVNTAFGDCDAYCGLSGMTCVQGVDNDNHNESGLGTNCVRYPIPDSKVTPHTQTTENNGCKQSWKNQICQCGLPP